MGFHINQKIAAKKKEQGTKSNTAASSSKFIPKTNTKSSGPTKKPIKTGGSRGS
jgi:hypothetical protein